MSIHAARKRDSVCRPVGRFRDSCGLAQLISGGLSVFCRFILHMGHAPYLAGIKKIAIVSLCGSASVPRCQIDYPDYDGTVQLYAELFTPNGTLHNNNSIENQYLKFDTARMLMCSMY